jgi:hypothetical protein
MAMHGRPAAAARHSAALGSIYLRTILQACHLVDIPSLNRSSHRSRPLTKLAKMDTANLQLLQLQRPLQRPLTKMDTANLLQLQLQLPTMCVRVRVPRAAAAAACARASASFARARK